MNNTIQVLKALYEGFPIPGIVDLYDLHMVKDLDGKRHTAVKMVGKEGDRYYPVEITLQHFVNKCESIPVSEMTIINANIALTKINRGKRRNK